MKSPGPNIVFMGTPEFAVESLKAILDAGYMVKGVVTSPDKASGRGLNIHSSPVKKFAEANNLPVLQPLKLKDPEFLHALRALEADLQVVVAFRMLPEEIWAMPPLGTFNLHASLLPQYRGAAPINHAIMNGETRTGVTTFFLNHEIDQGSVIYRQEIPIGPAETAGELHDRLMKIGAGLVIKTIEGIIHGQAGKIDQHEMHTGEILHGAPKIFKNDCRIDWTRDAGALFNFIRGLSPYPSAWTELTGPGKDALHVKIYYGRPLESTHAGYPGTLVTDNRSFMHVVAGKGCIAIDRIQLEGRKQMDISEFLRGFTVTGYSFR